MCVCVCVLPVLPQTPLQIIGTDISIGVIETPNDSEFMDDRYAPGSTCALSSAVAPVHNSEPQIGHRRRVANKSKTARRATGRPQRMSETPRIPDADRRRLIESIEQHGAATRGRRGGGDGGSGGVAVAVEPLVL
ncbi:hypothetical protein ALC56_14474 [Trachymyrmex septentrionalis]|uniref:Uncharacterized protein n=1 Tax=Trachymyrmex septentrionalis TaxID=34720 RepID=A0A195ESS3_9HYME|nr:hypothetical protein ALC56_14474 [Trachymyrmex septentrionalis]